MTKNKKEKLIALGFELIEKKGWNCFSLESLAKANKSDLETIKSIFKNKSKFLESFSIMIDDRVLAEIDQEEFKINSFKDNLFELIMLRFENLNYYKNGLKVLLSELKKSPVELKKIMKKILDSMDLFLEVSNSKSNYLMDFIKVNIIFIIYSYVFNVWLNDKSADMTKTMAELDKWLSQAEFYGKKINEYL
tara:strand:+ start:1933 stop:2508 length:576 start_codon:yes stop_codon:yes gene_type:complete